MIGHKKPAPLGAGFLCGLLLALNPVASTVAHAEDVERSLAVEFSSPLLATRGDAELTHLELDARIHKIPAEDRPDVIHDPERLQTLIEDQLQIRTFADRAIENGVLENDLARAELYMVVSTWLAERYRDNAIESEALDDYTDQAREIYILNPERFQTEPKVTFSHILISESDAARDRAAELLSEVEQGADFEQLARAHSDDPSATRNGGRFDAIETARLDAGFREGLADLEVGVPGLVKSGYGWHVVALHERLPAGTQPFEAVAEELQEEARQRHADQIVQRILRAYYAEELDIAEGAVAEVLGRYPFD